MSKVQELSTYGVMSELKKFQISDFWTQEAQPVLPPHFR
jgi:hypothetical protein